MSRGRSARWEWDAAFDVARVQPLQNECTFGFYSARALWVFERGLRFADCLGGESA